MDQKGQEQNDLFSSKIIRSEYWDSCNREKSNISNSLILSKKLTEKPEETIQDLKDLTSLIMSTPSMVSTSILNYRPYHQPADAIAKNEYEKVLRQEEVNLKDLSNLIHQHKVPYKLRGHVWKLLLGYLPTSKNDVQSVLRIKRKEYFQILMRNWDPSNPTFSSHKAGHVMHAKDNNTIGKLYRTISVDVARTNPSEYTFVFDNPQVKQSLERVLFLWSCGNQQISYFQGLNDLATPFYMVYLTEALGSINDEDYVKTMNEIDEDQFSSTLGLVEADVYWSLSLLMKELNAEHKFNLAIVHAFPMINQYSMLIDAINPGVIEHLNKLGISSLMIFATRWMLCLFIRELSSENLLYLWDAYMARSPIGFAKFHVYICVAYTNFLSKEILRIEEPCDAMFLFQNPPCLFWQTESIQKLIQDAQELWNRYVLL